MTVSSSATQPGSPSATGPTFKPRVRKRRWPVVVGVLVGIAVAVAAGAGLWVRSQLEPAGPRQPVEFTIASGATTADVIAQLGDAGVVGNTTAFRAYLRLKGTDGFEAGRYDGLTTNQPAGEVVAVLSAGPLPPEVARITIPEGLWLDEIKARVLENFPEMTAEGWDQAVATVRSAYQPDGATLEGLLYPATYEVALGDVGDATKLVTQMVGNFDRVADELGMADATATVRSATGLDLTPYEVITVASMVEAETRVADERPKVARVIYNRLIEGMRLDIDATTIYALGRRTDALTVDDLASSSPWNTRAQPGIPPSPIAGSGTSALAAALRPADGNWLYYVLVDPSGEHFFTSDYNEFLAAADDSRARGVF
jgi:UPF0755 protein